MKQLTNDENIKNLKTRKILRIIIIIFSILTILLAILSLTVKLGVGYSLVSFLITTLLIKKRESIPIHISKDLEIAKIEKAMKKQKDRKQK